MEVSFREGRWNALRYLIWGWNNTFLHYMLYDINLLHKNKKIERLR
jgi:hypothetical protein